MSVQATPYTNKYLPTWDVFFHQIMLFYFKPCYFYWNRPQRELEDTKNQIFFLDNKKKKRKYRNIEKIGLEAPGILWPWNWEVGEKQI